MNMASEDIKDLLEAEAPLGLTFGTNLFIGKEPAQPPNAVTIFDVPGRPPRITLAGKDDEVYYYSSVYIRVRDIIYTGAMSLARKIHDYLNGLHNIVVNGTRYELIYSKGEPSLLDWDDSGRARVILNFEIQRK